MPRRSDFAALAEVYIDTVQRAGRLRCATCPRERRCDSWDGKPVNLRLFDGSPRCPSAYRDLPWWQEVLHYDAALEVAPLAGWPDEYPMHVVQGLAQLRRARAKRAFDERR